MPNPRRAMYDGQLYEFEPGTTDDDINAYFDQLDAASPPKAEKTLGLLRPPGAPPQKTLKLQPKGRAPIDPADFTKWTPRGNLEEGLATMGGAWDSTWDTMGGILGEAWRVGALPLNAAGAVGKAGWDSFREAYGQKAKGEYVAPEEWKQAALDSLHGTPYAKKLSDAGFGEKALEGIAKQLPWLIAAPARKAQQALGAEALPKEAGTGGGGMFQATQALARALPKAEVGDDERLLGISTEVPAGFGIPAKIGLQGLAKDAASTAMSGSGLLVDLLYGGSRLANPKLLKETEKAKEVRDFLLKTEEAKDALFDFQKLQIPPRLKRAPRVANPPSAQELEATQRLAVAEDAVREARAANPEVAAIAETTGGAPYGLKGVAYNLTHGVDSLLSGKTGGKISQAIAQKLWGGSDAARAETLGILRRADQASIAGEYAARRVLASDPNPEVAVTKLLNSKAEAIQAGSTKDFDWVKDGPKITDYVEDPRPFAPGDERLEPAVGALSGLYKEWGIMAKDEGILTTLRNNYAPHVQASKWPFAAFWKRRKRNITIAQAGNTFVSDPIAYTIAYMQTAKGVISKTEAARFLLGEYGTPLKSAREARGAANAGAGVYRMARVEGKWVPQPFDGAATPRRLWPSDVFSVTPENMALLTKADDILRQRNSHLMAADNVFSRMWRNATREVKNQMLFLQPAGAMRNYASNKMMMYTAEGPGVFGQDLLGSKLLWAARDPGRYQNFIASTVKGASGKEYKVADIMAELHDYKILEGYLGAAGPNAARQTESVVPGFKHLYNFNAARWSEADALTRVPFYLHLRLDKGLTRYEAARRTNITLGGGWDADRVIPNAAQFIPFIRWYRFNVPALFQRLAQAPGRTGATDLWRRQSSAQLQEESPFHVTNMQRQNSAWFLENKGGAATWMSMTSWQPNADWNIIQPIASRAAGSVVEKFSPLLTAPFYTALGIDRRGEKLPEGVSDFLGFNMDRSVIQAMRMLLPLTALSDRMNPLNMFGVSGSKAFFGLGARRLSREDTPGYLRALQYAEGWKTYRTATDDDLKNMIAAANKHIEDAHRMKKGGIVTIRKTGEIAPVWDNLEGGYENIFQGAAEKEALIEARYIEGGKNNIDPGKLFQMMWGGPSPDFSTNNLIAAQMQGYKATLELQAYLEKKKALAYSVDPKDEARVQERRAAMEAYFKSVLAHMQKNASSIPLDLDLSDTEKKREPARKYYIRAGQRIRKALANPGRYAKLDKIEDLDLLADYE